MSELVKGSGLVGVFWHSQEMIIARTAHYGDGNAVVSGCDTEESSGSCCVDKDALLASL